MASSDSSNTVAIRSTRFFMRFAGFWIWNDRRGKLIMDVAMVYTISAILWAWVITASDLWFSRGSFYQAAYAASTAMTVLIILIKLTMFSIRRDEFMNLIKFCYDNFWQCKYNAFGEFVVRQCETQCIFFVWTFTLFAQCTVCSYTLHPVFENMGKNETDRILPFKIWLDLPVSTTPYFEILFCIEVLSSIHSGICYFCFDNLLCIMNVHVAGQFRILQRRFELVCYVNRIEEHSDSLSKVSLKDDYDEKAMRIKLADPREQYTEFKACIQKHQLLISFTKMVEDVYSFVILSQVVIFSVLICLVSYQAVLVSHCHEHEPIVDVT